MKISIMMLTHNAPKYVYESIYTIKKNTKTRIDYEIVVVDNKSRFITKLILKYFKRKKYIDHLVFNEDNSLFAKGNNIASSLTSYDTDYYLLLNSDVSIKDEKWLDMLLSVHPTEGGISSYGVVNDEPLRADGYCLLIDKPLYDKYKLDERFAWFWSITKIESQILKEDKRIVSVMNHEKYIHHYGGRSGKGFMNAAGMDIDIEEVKSWFTKGKVEVLNNLSPGSEQSL